MLKRHLSGAALATLAAVTFSIGDAAATEFAPQTSDRNGVKVTISPTGFSSSARTWDFKVVLETHTQNLGDDLFRSAMLIADGKRHVPLAWEGAPPGGHHRKGKLRFSRIMPQPASVELQIRLAGEATPRSFNWHLK